MGQQELHLQAQIARLFARAGQIADEATIAKYESVAATFGSEFEPAGDGDRFTYADSLVAAGILERRMVHLEKNGLPCPSRVEYRRVDLQAVAA